MQVFSAHSTPATNVYATGQTLAERQRQSKSPQEKRFLDIAQQYDMHHISPREVDQLINKLKDSGDFLWKDLAMLETKGEIFLSDINDNADSAFEATHKSDLIDRVQRSIEFSRQRNAPYHKAEALLAFMLKIDAA